MLGFLAIVDLVVLPAIRVDSALDQVAVAVNVNVTIFIQFQDALEDARLFFDSMVRDLELTDDVELVLFCELVLVSPERFDDVFVPENRCRKL